MNLKDIMVSHDFQMWSDFLVLMMKYYDRLRSILRADFKTNKVTPVWHII